MSLLAAVPAARATFFEPDEPINSIEVTVHTADVPFAGTDDLVTIELMDWPSGTPNPRSSNWVHHLRSVDDDFERNSTRTYALPGWYYQDRVVNDIRRVCIAKAPDSLFGGWAFGYVTVRVNGKDLFTSFDPVTPNRYIWLEDNRRAWCGSFNPIEFTAPVIDQPGLPDASPNEIYQVPLSARGGRKPLRWSITQSSGSAFATTPQIVAANAEGTQAHFIASTANTQVTAPWSGTVWVTDADGRSVGRALSMQVTFTLPPPVVTGFSPRFGWPTRPPSTPDATRVAIVGSNFDSRRPDATRVYFKANAGTVAAPVTRVTRSEVQVTVPSGAITGPIQVLTDFGSATSPADFTAHPNGYRFRSGLSFANVPGDFARSYAWERYEQTFGVCEMWHCNLGAPVFPDPIAALFYGTTQWTIDNGLCHGMALTSLQLREGLLSPSAYHRQQSPYPLDDSLWDLTGQNGPAEGISKTVQSRQLAMMSDEALSYYLEQLDNIPGVNGEPCRMDARTALNDVNASLTDGMRNPRMLAFAKACSPIDGHVVVPYRVDPSLTTAAQEIRVYDPNRPGRTGDPDDQDSVFRINPGDGSWSYDWGGGNLWQGLYMFTIPLSVYGRQHDWTLPGWGAIESGIGILFGFAGTDENGEIIQVSDGRDRNLYDGVGNVVTDRSLWPHGARPVPSFAPGARKRRIVALTEPSEVTFTIRRRFVKGSIKEENPALDADHAMFAFVQANGAAVTVEEVTDSLDVGIDPASRAVRLAPSAPDRTASAILRFVRRLPETAGSLSYAVRVSDLTRQEPLLAQPEGGGLGFSIAPAGAARHIDVEVTHIDRIGQVRVLRSDGIDLLPKTRASFSVTRFEDLDLAGVKPLRATFAVEGQPELEVDLGERIDGPKLDVPYHILATLSPESAAPTIRIDASKTTVPVPGDPLQFWSLTGDSIAETEPMILTVDNLQPGTRPIRLIAEDAQGRRSFPRTVFVTVPETDRRPISPLKLFGEDTTVLPGETGAVDLGLYLPGTSANSIVADLAVTERLWGVGSGFATFGDPAFEPAEELKSTGATVRFEVSGDRPILHLEVVGSTKRPLTGRIALGRLLIQPSAEVTLGSGFRVTGEGTVYIEDEKQMVGVAFSVLPALVRVWGGPEPATLDIDGPSEVREDQSIALKALATGMPSEARNTGWWVEDAGGLAEISVDPKMPLLASLTGRRAGWTKVHAVTGTKQTEKWIHVLPGIQTTPSDTGSGGGFPSRPPVQARKGDLNGDGRLDVSDAVLALRIAAGIRAPTETQRIAGDVNGDGRLDLRDTTLILRFVVGLLPAFP